MSNPCSYDVPGPIIKVTVGEDEEERIFYVHENVIYIRSDFFKNAMHEHWTTGQEKAVPLSEEEDPAAFSLYLMLLYRGQLPKEEQDPDDTQIDAVNCIYLTLASIYVAAEFLADPTTKNLLLGTILNQARKSLLGDWSKISYHIPQLEAIQVIYDRTPAGSLLLVELHDSQAAKVLKIRRWKGVLKDFRKEVAALRKKNGGINRLKAWAWSKDRYIEPIAKTNAQLRMEEDEEGEEE